VIRTRRRADVIALIGEVAAVAAADGVHVDSAEVLRLMDSVPGSMESSMQRDQAAARPLELDALGGALLRRAAKAGISVPVTARLVHELASRSERPAASA
jgi:2-dehydropantoate 2-reductase